MLFAFNRDTLWLFGLVELLIIGLAARFECIFSRNPTLSMNRPSVPALSLKSREQQSTPQHRWEGKNGSGITHSEPLKKSNLGGSLGLRWLERIFNSFCESVHGDPNSLEYRFAKPLLEKLND